MAAIGSGSFAKFLWPGLNATWGRAYNDYNMEYMGLFDTFTSRKQYEEDVGLTSFGLAQVKSEGGGVAYDNERQGFVTRYKHVEYALGFIITRILVEDDLYDQEGPRKAKSLARSMYQAKETVAANIYNNAFNNDGNHDGGDGVSLIASAGGGGDTSHPLISGGSYTNGPASAVDLSELAIEQACIDISKYTDDRGLKIKMMPDKLILPPDLRYEAERILKSPARVGTADNDLNALLSMGSFPGGVVINHYLTDADAWFIRTDCPEGMKHFERRAIEFTMDNDFDTDNAKYKATERYSFGNSDSRALWGSPGA